MKLVLLILTFTLAAIGCMAQNTITVNMKGFDSNEGTVRVGLYDKTGDFLNKAYKSRSSEISEKMAAVTFTDVPDGTYAISCFHDQNNDGELDMFMGVMPAEDYGCSNGAKGFFGPPKWEDAKFVLTGGKTKTVNISL
ncbi:MAG: hypothetical protein CMC08_00970 [Flavobacteriaceae bacterium]|nr:hypothetical protein [Flavobacteriaceae bacterium]|tara:strand:+ start:297 stop:710 length:414 start_codon:yes stop_codon:yes gene_type:complete